MTIPFSYSTDYYSTPKKVEIKTKEAKLKNMDVPIWTNEDVLSWVRRAGFSAFAEAFKESEVDGDLLLQLDENNLKNDLGIENGILRKRFTRELTNLKKSADYACVDRLGVVNFLSSIDQKSYAYGMILQDMSPEFMKRLTASDLNDMLKEAGVTNAVHRRQIIEAAHEQPDNTDMLEYDTITDMYDVYIAQSGLNQGSTEFASLLAIYLHSRGLSLFNPVEHLDLIQRICDTESCVLAANAQALKRCRNIVLVLGQGALDGCIGDVHCKDKLHREVKAALQTKDCNIIPVVEADFQFPDPEELPEDMRALCYFNSVRWVHDYQEACVDKLERFIRGDAFLKTTNYGNINNGGTRSPNVMNIPYSTQTSSRSRTDSGRSSPSRLTPLKINRQRNDSYDSAISP